MANSGGGSSNNTLLIVLLIGIVGILFFGCNMGISAICRLTGKKPGQGGLGGLFGGGGAAGGTDLSNYSEEELLALREELGVEEYPRVSLTEAMEFIANQIVKDIDAGTFTQLGRDRLFELKADLFTYYKSDLAEVAEFNDVRLSPLEGRALALYSRLLLEVARENEIALSPSIESAFQTNLFAGSPVPGVVTANRAFVIS